MLRFRLPAAPSHLITTLALALSFTGCRCTIIDGDGDDEGGGANGATTTPSTTTTSGGGGSAAGGPGGGGGAGGYGGGAGGGAECGVDPDVDADGDGFTPSEGDCDDCDAAINPGAVEVGTEPADENCDGKTNEDLPTCDDGIALTDIDPFSAARAMELCQNADEDENVWGLMDARWVRADGASVEDPGLQVGILEAFGKNVAVQHGKRMLALSSGHARLPDQEGACGSTSCDGLGPGEAPEGFPQDVQDCPGSDAINDDIGLEVALRAPKNATGFQFRFKFQSFEFPEWVCTSFNDQFIALVSPAPKGSVLGNISFDSKKNPVSVNMAFFDVCAPGSCAPGVWASHSDTPPPAPNPCCPEGPAELEGTGFDAWGDAGGTVWLKSTAPALPNEELTVRLSIWDTGDSALDSTVLLDHFEWLVTEEEVEVQTEPL